MVMDLWILFLDTLSEFMSVPCLFRGSETDWMVLVSENVKEVNTERVCFFYGGGDRLKSTFSKSPSKKEHALYLASGPETSCHHGC
jgi:hypothetical protein